MSPTDNKKRIHINDLFKSESLFRCILRAQEVGIINKHEFSLFSDLIHTRGKQDWWNSNNVIMVINLFYKIVIDFQKTFRYKTIFKVQRMWWKVIPYDFAI
jgi:hypothetical protein